jgi:hypothetical protein
MKAEESMKWVGDIQFDCDASESVAGSAGALFDLSALSGSRAFLMRAGRERRVSSNGSSATSNTTPGRSRLCLPLARTPDSSLFLQSWVAMRGSRWGGGCSGIWLLCIEAVGDPMTVFG